MSPANRQEMFRRLAAANPDPQSELEYGSPYQLLAAVLLSAQATDKSVNIVTRRLFPLAPTPQAMQCQGHAPEAVEGQAHGARLSAAKRRLRRAGEQAAGRREIRSCINSNGS